MCIDRNVPSMLGCGFAYWMIPSFTCRASPFLRVDVLLLFLIVYALPWILTRKTIKVPLTYNAILRPGHHVSPIHCGVLLEPPLASVLSSHTGSLLPSRPLHHTWYLVALTLLASHQFRTASVFRADLPPVRL